MHAGMVLVFVAERSSLKEYNQIQKSMKSLCHETWEMNKNTEVPFCAVRVDIAMEHINRSMKVWTIYNP